MRSGVTEQYVGSHTRETYNDRAASQFQTSWGAKFSETSAFDLIKAPVTDEEIRQWREVNEPNITDADSQNARRRAQNGVRRDRQAAFIKTAPPEKKGSLKDGSAGKGKEILSQRSASDVNISGRRSTSIQASVSKALSSAAMKDSSQAGVESNIDPRLLDEKALETMQIDAADFSALENEIIVTNASPDNHTSEGVSDTALTYAFFDDLDARTNEELTAEEFILKYAKINIVSKNYFARE
jgi:hypothetical protein